MIKNTNTKTIKASGDEVINGMMIIMIIIIK